MEAYTTVGTIEASRDGAPIHLTAFDPTEELLWSASQAGMVYSHLLPTAEPYSARQRVERKSRVRSAAAACSGRPTAHMHMRLRAVLRTPEELLPSQAQSAALYTRRGF